MGFSQPQDIVELQVKEHAGTRCRSFSVGAISAPASAIILPRGMLFPMGW
jgi:hypothetical protein